jgi:UDP-N-acetylmuramate: L-alanyl-gamma-D-glutamyl-meso-diaminopimelate ligase
MKLHILGICGTFMGGLALLARELGFEVSGSDAHVYPPMSTQLAESGIRLMEGYDPAHLEPAPDLVVVGNALSRGNPAIEDLLNKGLPYTSGPAWLADYVLKDRHVLAVSGTHGKTTTTSMLAWILESAGLDPGFLIGGVAQNFGVSARLGKAPFFVVEADEYDTAFFDKRSKFVHYRPRTLVINNLEFDHADIFPDLAAIQRQFHHLVRTVPGQGLILRPVPDTAIDEVLGMGCWTPRETFGWDERADWRAESLSPDDSRFAAHYRGQPVGEVHWSLIGTHNVSNALAAIAAARHAGVDPEQATRALEGFQNVKRRLEAIASIDGVTVYDDFAHHPTAIRVTLDALRRRVGPARMIVLFEPRSNTMRLGVHRDHLAQAFSEADMTLFYGDPNLGWDVVECTASLGDKRRVYSDINAIVEHLVAVRQPGDHIVIMSNGGFGGIHNKLIHALSL